MIFFLLLQTLTPVFAVRRDCFGWQGNLAITRLKVLDTYYRNCTIVNGNLVVSGIENVSASALSMFENIEEVTGYLLIFGNKFREISFPKLQIVWGDQLWNPGENNDSADLNQYSFAILSNALEQFLAPKLRSINRGGILIAKNEWACYLQKIDWRQFLNDERAPLILRENHVRCLPGELTRCDTSCGSELVEFSSRDNCWGPSPSHCQVVYRRNCAEQCTNKMCYKPIREPQYCCNQECAAGCTGPLNQDCIGCRGFRLEDRCVDRCPPLWRYDAVTSQHKFDPNGTYYYNRECVRECPQHMVIDAEACVIRCRDGYYVDPATRKCERCFGACPKRCILNAHLTMANIRNLTNCTEIDGKLELLQSAITGGGDFDAVNNRWVRYDPLDLELLELLSNVRVVTHYVNIQSSHAKLRSLHFLRNLVQIEGRTLFEGRFALAITDTQLEELGLVSLKQIDNGGVFISKNAQLCYAHRILWTPRILQAKNNPVVIVSGSRPEIECAQAGRLCASVCNQNEGCWGPGERNCLACRAWWLESTCVDTCDTQAGFFVKSKAERLCARCHPECDGGCNGPDASHCHRCRYLRFDGACMERCPNATWEDKMTSQCQPCHSNCVRDRPCFGPESGIGPNGCDMCSSADGEAHECLPRDAIQRMRCPDHLKDYFPDIPRSPWEQQHVKDFVCKRCHPACASCTSYGPERDSNGCVCAAFESDDERGTCVETCAEKEGYLDGVICRKCDPECDGCRGASNRNCTKCRNVYDAEIGACTLACPADRKYQLLNRTCSAVDVDAVRDRTNMMRIGAIVGSVAFLLILAATLVAVWFRRRYDRMRKEHIALGDIEIEPNPEAKPNLAQLRIILESELRKGDVLGQGAFGTVFQGVWIPAQGRGKKLPVAIKVLHESPMAGSGRVGGTTGSAEAKHAILDEAANMASVRHVNLVRLIGLCLSRNELMLVTPLMLLGNLLDFVQNNRRKLSSSMLLRWCRQIADGMAELERNRIVHRDLAARNVLVQTHGHVRVTDFGLAKMLDYGEEEYRQEEGGRMAIKWLALECIQHRRFTHKSDVWAYGVTVWEVLTFGDKPYKDLTIAQLPGRLAQGYRLKQPPIATMDVYMELIGCWMVEADSRPSFEQLSLTFQKWSQDPGRWLVIPGDKYQKTPSISTAEQRQRLCDAVRLPVEDIIEDCDEYYGEDDLEPLALDLRTQRSFRYSPEPHNLGATDDNYLVPKSSASEATTAVTEVPYLDVLCTDANSPSNLSYNLYRAQPPRGPVNAYYNCIPRARPQTAGPLQEVEIVEQTETVV